MANDLNQCNFIGRLGADPETRSTPNGNTVVNFRIAVGWKSKDSEGAEWVPVVAWGKLAEICSQYLKKGSRVFVSGKFRTRSWEQDGQKRYQTEIICNEMQMIDSKEGQQKPAQAPPAPAADFDDYLPF